MPSLGSLVFYGFAALAVVAAALVAFSRNLLHAALGLLMTLLAVAALYLWLGADFLGVTQLLVYVGGILVLFLFAVLLTSRIGDVRVSNGAVGRGLAIPVIGTAVLGLVVVLARAPFVTTEAVAAPTTARIGDAFLREYLLPFELASLVLLVALVAAMVLIRRSTQTPAAAPVAPPPAP
ncbi:MAG TPA: NADH-quinone oxidoreductase subunit J [Polyangia bacterium]